MKFSFSDEQEGFRTALRRFLSDTSPSVEVRRLMETDIGYDVDVWRQMSEDLGLTAIHIPESYGGQGFGVSELAIASEEMGRALLCAPYFASTVMAATAILKAGTQDQKQTLLPGIASGEITAVTQVHDTGTGCEAVTDPSQAKAFSTAPRVSSSMGTVQNFSWWSRDALTATGPMGFHSLPLQVMLRDDVCSVRSTHGS